MTPEDERLARASRLLRRQAGLRQVDLGTSRFVTQQIEAGRIGQLRVDVVRGHFAALGARAQLGIWWNGAGIDRLLDDRHAWVVDRLAGQLPRFHFRVLSEYSFNEFGERGSIDIFGGRDDVRAVFVGEAKSEWGSMEETLRRQDMKRCLAPKLAEEAFGWRANLVASVLIFPDDSTARRTAQRFEATLAGYPARGREIRAWLQGPSDNLGGIWFLSNAATVRHRTTGTG
ncbi:MAG: hypothetical protein ABI725_04640 [Chloroflexota bacterium]